MSQPTSTFSKLRVLGLLASSTIVVASIACQSGHQNVVDGNRMEAKGKVEAATGDVTGNDSLKVRGRLDQAAGDVQKAAGTTQETIDHAVDSAVDAAAHAKRN